MHQAIRLAREALMLFIQSLPFDCKFNVCSYGSEYDFLFSGGSLEYNDNTLSKALGAVS